jgi:hypothetical protein
MSHDEVTAKIDRRIEKRKPEVTASHWEKWERQWDTRHGRSKPTMNALLFDREHEWRIRQAVARAA